MLEHYHLGQYRKALISRQVAERLYSTTSWKQLLSQRQIESLTHYMTLYDIPKGNTLFKEGDIDHDFIIVLRGLVNISKRMPDGDEKGLMDFGNGNFFGEMALIDRQRRSATAVTKQDSLLLYLSPESLAAMEDKQPRLATLFLKKLMIALSGRLRVTTLKIKF